MGCDSSKNNSTGESFSKGTTKEAYQGLSDDERRRILNDRLPRMNTPQDEARRVELFTSFGGSADQPLDSCALRNGILLKLDLYHVIPNEDAVASLAFLKTTHNWEETGHLEDRVALDQFRVYVNSIADFFELALMFCSLKLYDAQHRYMRKEEFLSNSAAFSRCGVEVFDLSEVYKTLDTDNQGWLSFGCVAWWLDTKKIDEDFQTLAL